MPEQDFTAALNDLLAFGQKLPNQLRAEYVAYLNQLTLDLLPAQNEPGFDQAVLAAAGAARQKLAELTAEAVGDVEQRVIAFLLKALLAFGAA